MKSCFYKEKRYPTSPRLPNNHPHPVQPVSSPRSIINLIPQPPQRGSWGHGGRMPSRAPWTRGGHGDPADHRSEDPLLTRRAAGRPSAYGKQPGPFGVAPGSQGPVRRPFLRTQSHGGRMVCGCPHAGRRRSRASRSRASAGLFTPGAKYNRKVNFPFENQPGRVC